MTNRADLTRLEKLTGLIRHYILTSTTAAGSGHPTSSLSAVELIPPSFSGAFSAMTRTGPISQQTAWFFPRAMPPLCFIPCGWPPGKSPGSIWRPTTASRHPLEGHPTVKFPYVEAATGSLGQGCPWVWVWP